MRDTGVYLGDTEDTLGSRLNKLNSAYHYGGVGMMINTINVTFGLDIQRFVMFDFGSAAEIIDLCGGVDIEIEPTAAPLTKEEWEAEQQVRPQMLLR